jgi:hypothetical protein
MFSWILVSKEQNIALSLHPFPRLVMHLCENMYAKFTLAIKICPSITKKYVNPISLWKAANMKLKHILSNLSEYRGVGLSRNRIHDEPCG